MLQLSPTKQESRPEIPRKKKKTTQGEAGVRNEGDPHVPKLMNNGMVRPLHLAKLDGLVASPVFCLRNNGLEELKDCRETRKIGWT